ncbi:MAG: porin [Comamonadaceae bacterium]|nr:porin [Comamonadaceae bacterium]
MPGNWASPRTSAPTRSTANTRRPTKRTPAATQLDNSGLKQYTLGYNYNLSKRTMLKAYYTEIRNDDGSAADFYLTPVGSSRRSRCPSVPIRRALASACATCSKNNGSCRNLDGAFGRPFFCSPALAIGMAEKLPVQWARAMFAVSREAMPSMLGCQT